MLRTENDDAKALVFPSSLMLHKRVNYLKRVNWKILFQLQSYLMVYNIMNIEKNAFFYLKTQLLFIYTAVFPNDVVKNKCFF